MVLKWAWFIYLHYSLNELCSMPKFEKTITTCHHKWLAKYPGSWIPILYTSPDFTCMLSVGFPVNREPER